MLINTSDLSHRIGQSTHQSHSDARNFAGAIRSQTDRCSE